MLHKFSNLNIYTKSILRTIYLFTNKPKKVSMEYMQRVNARKSKKYRRYIN